MTDMTRALRTYLIAGGWSPLPEPGPQGRLWRRPDETFAVPVPEELDNSGPNWTLLLERLAMIEGVLPQEVERRIRASLVDVANLRAANEYVIEDSIPLPAGVALVRESWAMLRSCATTSLGPRAHIAGNYRPAGDALIQGARMAHTRQGSFIVPIYLPVPTAEEPKDQIDGLDTAPAESGERRVMRTFAQTLRIIEGIAQTAADPTANDVQDLVHNGASHEFAASLGRILSQPAVSEFSAEFEWAPAAGPAPATPSRTVIEAAAAPIVERVSARLKAQKRSQGVEVLTGPVIRVQRDHDDTGGVVTIQTVRATRACHVSVNVSRERLDQSLDWMKQRLTAQITGRVHRAGSDLVVTQKDSIGLLSDQQLH